LITTAGMRKPDSEPKTHCSRSSTESLANSKPLPNGHFSYPSANGVNPVKVKLDGYSEYLPQLGDTILHRMMNMRLEANFPIQMGKIKCFPLYLII